MEGGKETTKVAHVFGISHSEKEWFWGTKKKSPNEVWKTLSLYNSQQLTQEEKNWHDKMADCWSMYLEELLQSGRSVTLLMLIQDKAGDLRG